jgi:transcriptional regulator with XRE-family HTH domain
METAHIALNVRKHRLKKGLTVEALAEAAGITKGFVSQVENFRAMPSIPMLLKLAAALEIEPGQLLVLDRHESKYLVTRRGRGKVVEREYPDSGFIYRALASAKSDKLMEPFLLELPPHSTRKNLTTNGDEFLYVLQGKMNLVLGTKTITLSEGDSLYFDGSIPHHPENRTGRKALLLVLYAVKRGE